ncbi:DUF4252 domain-containing protein [Ichthyenterobacterium sp. W332]|uniref:DUF4252 domain-containing protein n=1 Tax=Microcosmobacter mediterraneus TaxID=3075607 RepID=A0ABU2YIG7_9FLAO|nr:DUF4252 domain-containing protein [Ichthyenterobacterium sp. W332]MDT0557681.1 DUF4252 domain-containing protein [Ichthyenterobacterium sp. W332]
MLSLIKRTVVLGILVVAFTSCNQNPTLQTYYVDNELRPGFTTLDIPTSFVGLDEKELTPEQLDAYESVDKLNMLAFVLDENNKENYEVELAKVKTILENPKYEELMRGGNTTDGKFVIKLLGEEDDIDEIILFGSANERGFALVRILGNSMNPEHIMSLASALESKDFKDTDMTQFTNFFK